VIKLISVLLAVLAPLFEEKYILYVLILGKFFAAMSSVIYNVIRAPFGSHLARADNLSDCSAKEGN
jgi:hypothetical protein